MTIRPVFPLIVQRLGHAVYTLPPRERRFKEIIRFFTTHGELVVNNRETARAWWVPLIKVRSFDHSTCALSFDSLSKVLFIFRSLYLCAITLLVRYHHHQ